MKKTMNDAINSFKSSRNVILGSMGFVFGFGVILILSFCVQIVVSETDSHSKHYFLHLKFYKPGLSNHSLVYSEWYGKKIIKKIVGVEGDKIWYDQTHCLWVGNQRIGFQKPISKDMRALTPIEGQVIPKGYAFVYSEHQSSFDSRYQELGLVPVTGLEGFIVPLI